MTRTPGSGGGGGGGTEGWAAKAPMQYPRIDPGVAAAADGKIYVAGGVGQDFIGPFGVVEMYDPATNAWTERAPLLMPRYSLGLVAANNGRLYAIGGFAFGTSVANVDEYNPTTNTWTPRAPMPAPLYGFGAALAGNGKIYVVGGFTELGPVASTYEYDPATNTWATRASLPSPRNNAGVAAGTNGRIYAAGGRGVDIGPFGKLAELLEYNPATNTWTAKAPMPMSRAWFGFAKAPNGKLYAVGGDRGDLQILAADGVTAAVVDEGGTPTDEYDPATNSWSERAAIPFPRQLLGLATAGNGKMYAIGGMVPVFGAVASAANEEYTPPGSGGSVSGPTNTRTITPTRTPSRTRTITPTRTRTLTRTITPTRTPSRTRTITPTRTVTLTRTVTKTRTVTVTRTPSRTRTITPTRTPTQTRTPVPLTAAQELSSSALANLGAVLAADGASTNSASAARITWSERVRRLELAPGETTTFEATLTVDRAVSGAALRAVSRGWLRVDPASLPSRLEPGRSYAVTVTATMPGKTTQVGSVEVSGTGRAAAGRLIVRLAPRA